MPFVLDVFSGCKPRLPDSLLAASEASLAQWCDFAYGELRPLRRGFRFLQMRHNNIRAMYTDDGLNFFTWSQDVDAVRSPLAADQYNRMYYTGEGANMRVANRLSASTRGGAPSGSYRVGVPRPSAAPKLTAAELPVPSADKANFDALFFFELGGVRYQVTPLYVSAPSTSGKWIFTPPKRADDTPENATPVLYLYASWKDSGEMFFDGYSTNCTLQGADSYYRLTMVVANGSLPAGEWGGLEWHSVGNQPKEFFETTFQVCLDNTGKSQDKQARAYVYTFVNNWNEESAPSEPASVTCLPELGVTVEVSSAGFSGDFVPLKEIRIYRTADGASGITEYFFCGSLPMHAGGAAMTFEDNTPGALLNDLLTSYDYVPPPSGLRGLTLLPNGILMAFRENELFFSEAYKPWAWPPQYAKTLCANVVGAIAHGSGALVTTKSYPYQVSGVSPDAMTTTRVAVDQAGASKWAMAVIDGLVVYASHDGLVTVSGVAANLNAGNSFFTRETWRERVGAGLSGVRFAVWDGRLIVFSGEGAFVPFLIRLDEADGTMTDLPGFIASCAMVSALTDQCYYANADWIWQFGGGNKEGCVWRSREVVLPHPTNFGAVQAWVDGQWVLDFEVSKKQPDGTEQWHLLARNTVTANDSMSAFRLPAGMEYERIRLRVACESAGRLRKIAVGKTFRELAQV